MDEFCATHPYKTEMTKRDLEFIVVDDKHKIVYCTIPKVGTTTWKTILAQVRGLRKGVRVHRWNLWRRLYQYSEEERSKILQSYFKFVFVREPLGRLLSAYKDKFIGADLGVSREARARIVKTYRPQDLKLNHNFVNFSEFVQYFSQKNVYRNQHWREYEKLCHPCVIKYDFIGHLETLEDDAALVLKMAGIDDRVTFPPIHKSTGSSDVLQYYSKVSPQYIARLGESYRNDFEMFGYDYLGGVQHLLKNSKPGTEDTDQQAELDGSGSGNDGSGSGSGSGDETINFDSNK